MFKLKMSLLLKSVKFRVAIVALVIATVLVGIILIPKNKAADLSNQVTVVANKSGVTANGKKFYVIRKSGNATGYDVLFCIEEGASLSSKTYSNPIEISGARDYFEDYNRARWVINNMYTTNITGENGLSNEDAKNISALNLANLLTSDKIKAKVAEKGLDTSSITPQKIYNLRNKSLNNSTKENALEFMEQVVLWKYTKNISTSFVSAYTDNVNQFLEGTTLTSDEQLTLKYAVYAFGAAADMQGGAEQASTVSNCVVLKKDEAKVDTTNYKVGPYYLESNGIRLTSYNFGDVTSGAYPASATITKSDGSTETVGTGVFEKNNDGSFYINLANYKGAQKVEFKIDYVLSTINTQAHVLDGGNKQNLLTVNKSVSATSLTDSKTINVPSQYNVILKKVKSDGTTVITSSEAVFTINGKEQTTSKGVLNVAQGKSIANAEQVDTYEIVETKAPEGFIGSIGTAKLTVKFKHRGNTYAIDKDNTTLEGIDGASLEVSEENATVTVCIQNDEKEGTFNVVLKKVKNDGTTLITSSEATFKINDKEQNTTKGVLNIAEGKTIVDENQNEVYKIVETKAPEGFLPIKGEATLSVKFKLDGKKYLIDTQNTTFEGTEEMKDAKFQISDDKTTITIYVPNDLQPATYNLELYKVNEKDEIINTPAKFEVNGKEAITNGGKIQVASNVKVEDENTVGTYVIKETEAPENYVLFGKTVKVTVQMTKVNDKLTLTDDGVKLYIEPDNDDAEDDTKLKDKVKVKLEGTTIKVYVPNTKMKFDLALRKYISAINDKKVEPSREPIINEESIKILKQTGTAAYYHTKNSIGVKVGDEVEYTIRVYNEGEILGFAKQITDYLPDGLSFVRLSDSNSKEYTTKTEAGSKVVVIDYSGNTTIKTLRDFYDKKDFKVTSDYYQEVKLICKVEDTEKTYITNRGEITNYGYSEKDADGNTVWKEAKKVGETDIDSAEDTIKDDLNLDTWYEDAKEYTYKDENGNEITVDNYYPGVQDDDDFETLELLKGEYTVVIKKVDEADRELALEGAYFSIKGSGLEKTMEVGPTGKNGEVTLIKNVQIYSDEQVDKYTIKETKAPKDYVLYGSDIVVKIGTQLLDGVFVIDEDNVEIDQKDVDFYVNDNRTIITIVIPDTKKEFDLSLRKFITEVNGEELTESREPQVDVSKLASGESQTATYVHPKDPVDVNTTDIVTYTIRVYNEGARDGYASEIMDDIPEGLEFVPAEYDKEGKPLNTNAKYKWVAYKEMTSNEVGTPESILAYNGKSYIITDDVKEADLIVTDYLSKENGTDNLLKGFDPETMKELDYKDVKVSFKVTEPTTSDRILTNYAQITEDTDSEGKPVTDRDSTPNEWIDGEDDQDIEKIKVRYFDLSLRKWVTKAIVYENGNETITETNHTPYDDPEEVVKVDLKNTSIDNVEVKFEYSIRITNEGEIEGYAKEISDYIPAGLAFDPSDNPQWTEENGKIVTRALENTLLQPGEYADVTVILTWINGADNLGLKTNIAEISEDYNDWGTPDIDSTPNNKKDEEDDIDDAPVVLTVVTGVAPTYIAIIASSVLILGVGAFIIKKYVI